MSLLSTPTGRPERVFSLLSLVRSMGGRVKSSDAIEWLAPQYRSADNSGTESKSKSSERVREFFRVARDLNLLDADADDWISTNKLPDTRRAFARYVHAHLCGLPLEDPDAVLLRAYAWCTAFVESNGIATIVSMQSGDLASGIDSGLGRKGEDADRVFNTTKLPAWKDWMAFIGLGWSDLPGINGFIPDPSRRIEEELQDLFLSTLRTSATDFLSSVAKSLPYLDGGFLFEEAFKKDFTHPPQGQISLLLSQALRSLEQNDILKCEMEGDTRSAISLFPDPLSATSAFSHISRIRNE